MDTTKKEKAVKKLVGFEMLAVALTVGVYFFLIIFFRMSVLYAAALTFFVTAIASTVSFAFAQAAIVAFFMFVAFAPFSASNFSDITFFSIFIASILFVTTVLSFFTAKELNLKFMWVFGSLAVEAVVILTAIVLTPWAALGVLILPFFLLAPAEKQALKPAV